MAGLLIVPGLWPVFDANGDPVSGATIRFYEPGTTTPKAVYSDATLATSLGTQLTTNAGGEPTTLAGAVARLWWAADAAEFDVQVTAGASTRTWTGVNVTYSASSDMSAGVSVRWFGARGDGTVNDAPAFQAVINQVSGPPSNGFSHIIVPPGNYRFDTAVTIPNGVRIKFDGRGDARIFTNNDIILFDYVRPESVNFTQLRFENIWFEKVGGVGTSVALSFVGPSTTYANSLLWTTKCQFRGFWRAVVMGHAGGSFDGGYHANNSTDFYFTRNASFIDIVGITSLLGDYFIYGDDAIGGGISNTINVMRCTSVFKQITDIRLRGWDALKVIGGGCDLGGSTDGASQSAFYLENCTNTDIIGMYVSSATTGSPNPRDNRIGVNLVNCQATNITDCRIVDNGIGVRVEGPASIGSNTKIKGVTFRNNKTNHVIAIGAGAGIVADCTLDNTPNRASTNFEIYMNTAGSTGWRVTDNIFEGTSYTITTAGNSNVSDNIFGEPLP